MLRPVRWFKRTASLGVSIGKEAGAGLIATELYPLGLLSSVPQLPVPWTHAEGERTAVVFLHGLFHNRSAFGFLKNRLAWEGYRRFYELNLATTRYSIASLSDQVRRTLDRITHLPRFKKVVIVAHSMGGIIARHYLQKRFGDGKVSHLVTLGTGHQGVSLSRFSPLPHLHELGTESALLQELNELPAPSYTKVLNLYGANDLIIRPKAHAEWPGMVNERLSETGHLSILFSRRAARRILQHLEG